MNGDLIFDVISLVFRVPMMSLPNTTATGSLDDDNEFKTNLTELFMLSAITIFSLIGNLMVIAVIYKSRRTQWLTNLFVAHLAAVNLCVPFICAPIYFNWLAVEEFLMGSFGCKLVHVMTFIISCVSAGMLASMALDRYYVISNPLSVHMARSQTYHIIAFVWVISLFATTPLLYFYNLDNDLCMVTRNGRSWKGYIICFTALMFVLPLIIVYALHVRVFIEIHKRNKGNATVNNSDVSNNNGLGEVPRTKQKVVRMLIFQSIVFGICGLPYFLVSSISHSLPDTNWHQNTRITLLVVWSNSALNPLIYAAWNGNFRRGCRNLLGCQVSRPYTITKVMSRKHQVDVFESGRHDSIVRGINLMRVRGSITNSYLGHTQEIKHSNVALLFRADNSVTLKQSAWPETCGSNVCR